MSSVYEKSSTVSPEQSVTGKKVTSPKLEEAKCKEAGD